MITWMPVDRSVCGNFKDVEHALELKLHPDVAAFYGSFWSSSIEAETEEGRLTLIQIWNQEDFDNLCGNLIGHALAKQRIGAPLTIFLACTDEDELILSLDNNTGEVVLEHPGERPLRVVETSLTGFLSRLNPVVEAL